MTWLENEHFPPTLPTLGEDVASGDVEAIYTGAVRLLLGETITCTGRNGEHIVIRGSVVTVDGEPRECGSSHDALVSAYRLIGNFNAAWADFGGIGS